MRIQSVSGSLVVSVAIFSLGGHCTSIFDPGHYREEDIIRKGIAVIGGGASRTYAAITLGDMGKDVVLVERASRLGGHENSYTDPATGINVDYGVQAYYNISVTRDFFARFDIPIVNYTFGEGSTIFADFSTGQPLPDFTPGENLSSYVQQLAKYPDLTWSWDLQNPIPEELLLPFRQFIEECSVEDAAFLIFDSTEGVANPPFLDQLTVNVFKWVDQGYINDLSVGGDVTTA